MTFSPSGFWSYAHSHDENSGGHVLRPSRQFSAEFRLLTGTELQLFVDRTSLEWGDEWREKVDTSIQVRRRDDSLSRAGPSRAAAHFTRPAPRPVRRGRAATTGGRRQPLRGAAESGGSVLQMGSCLCRCMCNAGTGI